MSTQAPSTEIQMSTQAPSTKSRRLLWAGRVVSALPVLMLLMSTFMKLSRNPDMTKQFVEKLGYPEGTLTGLGVLELACVALYLVPQTAVLGAVLLTGYLGGAITTHLRVGDPFVVPALLGALVWAGLYLRDEKLRALLPLRKAAWP